MSVAGVILQIAQPPAAYPKWRERSEHCPVLAYTEWNRADVVDISQIRVTLSGFPGGPGVSTFYCQGDEAVLISRLKTFYEAAKTAMPDDVTVSFPTTGRKIDLATGQPSGTWTANATADTRGTEAGVYAAPCGLVFNWYTGLFQGGREVRGKTFLVPMVTAIYGTTGQVAAGDVAAWNARATALIGNEASPGDRLCVYSPTYHAVAPVVAGRISTKVAVLRSRRD